MTDPSILVTTESLLLRAGIVGASVVVAWSARHCLPRPGRPEAAPGEAVWTAVALVVLAAVVASVGSGGRGAV